MTASTPRSSRISARTRGCCSSAALGEKDASVARPPRSRRAGPPRRSSRHFRRESPAHQLCGAAATLLAPRLSRIPRTSTVRGRCDTPRALTVARPPQDRSAGHSRRSSRRFRRETPAYRLCGGLATSPALRPLRIPRTSTVRGVADVLIGTSVAKPPHTGRAGPLRHFSHPDCRKTPAYRLCGAVATPPPRRTPFLYCANLFESV